MFDFAITLDSTADTPLYEQLSVTLSRAIEDGRLSAGSPMPSTRAMATRLGISRDTVIKSLELLYAQGYLESIAGKGTRVCNRLPGPIERNLDEQIEPHIASNTFSTGSKFLERLLDQDELKFLPHLNYLAPTEERTPLAIWRRLLQQTCKSGVIANADYPQDPLGYLPLRAAVSDFLKRAWSLPSKPQQIAVFTGPLAALDLVCRIFLNSGDTVAVGNPGIRRPPRLLRAHGLNLLPIDVDDDGMRVDDLSRVRDSVKLVYVSPAHQLPTGALMSLSRRKALLQWAHQTGALIMEDDYGCQFTPESRRLATLQGLDKGECVLYLSSFWELLYPLVQFGFLLIPWRLIPAVASAQAALESSISIVEQAALAEFINAGHLERLIRRNSIDYPARRQALTESLIKHLKNDVKIKRDGSATSVLVTFNTRFSDKEILRASSSAGLAIVSSAPYYLKTPPAGQFMIPLGPIGIDGIESKIRKMAELLAHN